MEHVIDHVFGALALLFSGFALFLNRRGVRATRRTQKLSDIIPKAVDAALRHQAQGSNRSIDIRTIAGQFARNHDLEDKKRDFTDEKIDAEVVAELHRRGL